MTDESRIFRLEDMSHTALCALDPARTFVVAAISPIETHGPHLPVGQDWFEAIALMEHSAARAVAQWPDWNVLLLPPVPVGCDTIPHLGSINYPAPLVRDVAYYTLRPFAKRGFARLAFSSFHGGPRHFCALEDAAHKLTRRHGVAAMSFFSVVAARMAHSNIFHDALKDDPALDLPLDMIAGDLHAGVIETSFALHLWPHLVDAGWQDLPPLAPGGGDPHGDLLFGDDGPAGLLDALGKARSAIQSAGAAVRHYKQHTYAGTPAQASEPRGHTMFSHLLDVAMDIIGEFIENGRGMDVHSPVWPLRQALLSPAVNTVVDDWLHFYSD